MCVCVCVCVCVDIFLTIRKECAVLYRYPDMQASRPIHFSYCALYSVKAFQKKGSVGLFTDGYVSVGVKLPDGTYDRPAQVKHFYWLLPGEYASGSIIVTRMGK